MGDGCVRELSFQLVYEVCHKYPKQRRAQPAALRNSTQDFSVAIRRDFWVQDSDFNDLNPFPEVLPHSAHDVISAQ